MTIVSRSGGISASTCATVAAFPTGTKRLTTLSASAGSPGGRGSPDRVRSAPSPAEFVSGEHDVVVEHCGYSHDAPGGIPPGADQPRSAPLPAMMAR